MLRFSPSRAPGETSPDLFSEIIRYGIPLATIPGTSTPQYNGNISQIEWQVAGREGQAYSFAYDDLDRLTDAIYSDRRSNGTYLTDNKFREKAVYDVRGNITSLLRTGQLRTENDIAPNNFNKGVYGIIDDLLYTYNTKNQVIEISEATTASATKGFRKSNATGTAYTYDANGNMTSDANKGITLITYNYLNLPSVITFTNNRQIQFTYTATGVKLNKKVINGATTTENRDYIGGQEFVGGAAMRIQHAEGAIVRDAGTGGGYHYEFSLKDHLGNTRVTFTEPKSGDIVSNLEIDQAQINHYYPFGLNMEGNWNGAGDNKYQYNGKELNTDFDLNWNDYGARWYDPAMARWTTVDPLAEKMRRHSPYNYGFDNPMRFVDPDGMEPQDNKKKPDPIVKTIAIDFKVGTKTMGTVRINVIMTVNSKTGKIKTEVGQPYVTSAVKGASFTATVNTTKSGLVEVRLQVSPDKYSSSIYGKNGSENGANAGTKVAGESDLKLVKGNTEISGNLHSNQTREDSQTVNTEHSDQPMQGAMLIQVNNTKHFEIHAGEIHGTFQGRPASFVTRPKLE
jgi:RHS repeat-associated protein